MLDFDQMQSDHGGATNGILKVIDHQPLLLLLALKGTSMFGVIIV